jgi:predicted metal-binding protein
MTKIGILGCNSTTHEMNCVMIGCFGNLRERKGSFTDYPQDEPVDLVGVIHCGGCPTAVGTDRIWQKVQALVEYGIDSLHLTSCLVQICPFKDAFIDTIQKDFPKIKVKEGTHPFHDVEAFKSGVRELVSQRAVPPQRMNDLVFKRIKIHTKDDEKE